ncbi:threonylcarbamoyl-AMP synthase [Verrucomicrobiaceae bacterium N1E253]|uniref:Threonylcarbamoyl-AMP synthase n=1 Tax=Oceaniferula marina TaxID=2748318 RepID=A0A851GAT9_9BACT|nr:L-threonylcarbamoyladenylate synthase [Oceaniferula marina]NWK54733.1 threonylcarbamoyl-AMP synthase [Oceaniferula marina]
MNETCVIDASDPSKQKKVVQQVVDLLHSGEVVALPTETVYGLGADALNADAVAKVFAAKERPEFDPLIVHVGSYEQVAEVADVPEELETVVQKLMKAFWPGPLTLVLPKKSCVPDIVTSGLPTVAVRMSGHPIMKAVVRGLGRPIAAPSANRFGRISPTSASAVEKELGGRIPAIVDGGACREGLESTIIRPEAGEKRPVLHLLRAGPVTKEMLQRFGKVERPKRRLSRKDRAQANPEATQQAPEVPGQLAAHYAPRTPLRVLRNAAEFKPEAGKRYALLSYCGSEKAGFIQAHAWDVVEELSPGNGKLAEAAVRFFFVLRQLDESGVDEIIAEPVSETGLGVAIMDRLRRASYGSQSGAGGDQTRS